MKEMTFGGLLRETRRNSGKTIDDVVNLLGCTKTYLMDIELGRRNPPQREKIIDIANFFNLDPETLFKLATKSRGKIALPVNNANAETAHALAGRWENLTPEQHESIRKIIE